MELAYIDVKDIPRPSIDYREVIEKMARTRKGVKIRGKDVGGIQARIHAATRRYLPKGYSLRTMRDKGFLLVWLERVKKNGRRSYGS